MNNEDRYRGDPCILLAIPSLNTVHMINHVILMKAALKGYSCTLL